MLLISLVAINFKNIEAYLSILGGFCVVIMSFLFPGMLYIKNNEHPITHWKNVGSILLMIIITIIGFTAGVKTIIEMF